MSDDYVLWASQRKQERQSFLQKYYKYEELQEAIKVEPETKMDITQPVKKEFDSETPVKIFQKREQKPNDPQDYYKLFTQPMGINMYYPNVTTNYSILQNFQQPLNRTNTENINFQNAANLKGINLYFSLFIYKGNLINFLPQYYWNFNPKLP